MYYTICLFYIRSVFLDPTLMAFTAVFYKEFGTRVPTQDILRLAFLTELQVFFPSLLHRDEFPQPPRAKCMIHAAVFRSRVDPDQ